MEGKGGERKRGGERKGEGRGKGEGEGRRRRGGGILHHGFRGDGRPYMLLYEKCYGALVLYIILFVWVSCAAGYYGNPMEPGNSCKPCQCHGNSFDAHGRDLCDRRTGVCLSCSDHTEGQHCERCQRGYYGTAVMGDCQGSSVCLSL